MRKSLPLHTFLGLVLVFGLWSPAGASQIQEASLPNTQEKSDLVAMHTPDKDGWVQADAGVRPAYVGIQGGTARVSLMRASNGMLFAFTGQTGNDFAHIVRGHDGNGSTKESQPAQEAAAPAGTAQPVVVTAEAAAQGQPAQNDALVPAKASTATGPMPSTTDAQAPTTQATAQADAPKEVKQAPVAPAVKKAETPSQAVAEAPVPAAPQSDTTGQSKAAKNSLDALVSDLPKNGNDKVIFATAGLAERLSANPGELAPFGLSAADREYNQPSGKDPSKAERQAKIKPLRLRDYRAALQTQS